MSARRCSTCSIEYPSLATYALCMVCGEQTSFFTDVDPQDDWKERVQQAHAEQREDAERAPASAIDARYYDPYAQAKIVDWRVECFRRLEFSPFQSQTMAVRRDIDRVAVERMRQAGATPKQVVEIVL